jgi:hypothetical protein
LLLVPFAKIAMGQRITISQDGDKPISKKEYNKIKKGDGNYSLIDLPDPSDHLLFLKDNSKKMQYVFVVISNNTDLTLPRSKWTLYKISENANSFFEFDKKMLKSNPTIITPGIISFINGTTLMNKSFDTVRLVYLYSPVDKGNPTSFYRGLYLRSALFYTKPIIIPLDLIQSVEERLINYERSDMDYKDLTSTGGGALTDSIAFKPAITKKKIVKTDTPSVTGNAFNYSCSGNYNFNINIKPGKATSAISIHNNIANTSVSKPAATTNTQKKPITTSGKAGGQTTPTTTTSPTNAQKKPATDIGKTTDTGKTVNAAKPGQDSSLQRTIPDTSYTYSNVTGFDAVNFSIWLKNTYPKLNSDCAAYLTAKISDEIHLSDTTAAMGSTKTATTSNKKAKGGGNANLIKPGKISIASTKPIQMNVSYSGKKPIDTKVNIIVQVKGDYDSTANQLVFVNKDSTLVNNPHIDTITITKDAWQSAVQNSGGLMPLSLIMRTSVVKDTLKDPVKGYLVISSQSQGDAGSQSILLKPGTYTNDMPFWMEMGSNFDLLNFKPNHLYAGILAFEKDLTHIDVIGLSIPISFTGGVYESKSSSASNPSVQTGNFTTTNSFTNVAGKGYPYYTSTDTASATLTVQTTSMFFSTLFRLNQIPSKTNGFHIYASIYAEMLWQNVTSSITHSKINTDSVNYAPTLTSVNSILSYPQNSTLNYDFRSHYFGLGMPIYIKQDDYTFFMNPVIGRTNQKFTFSQEEPAPYNNTMQREYEYPNPAVGFLIPRKAWNTFYIAQFRLTSEYYGVSLTGEVRGLFLHQNKPIVSLAISKKFDIGKVLGGFLGQ